MSRQREEALRQRQLALQWRSDGLRQQLAEQSRMLQAPLAWVDRARSGWQWVQAHPQWPLAGAAAVLLLRPRRALRWGLRAWWAWQGLLRLQRKLTSMR